MIDSRRATYLSGPSPRVIAHRGFGASGPGNTLDSFRRALEAGADLLETDVRASVDGVALLVHDPEVVDIDGAAHRIDRERWEDLAALTLPGGEHLVSLEQALRSLPDARFNLDVKAADAVVPVVATVRGTRSTGRVLIASFSEARRAAAVRRLPGVATSASAPRVVAALLGAHLRLPPVVRTALRGCDALQVPERVLGLTVTAPAILDRLRAAGCEVHVWTIDDPRRMIELLQRGVDGIITDRTDLARAAVDEFSAARTSGADPVRNTPPT